MNRFRIVLLMVLLIVCIGWENGFAEMQSITVFCGSANKPAMEEIAAKFKEDKNVEVNMIFGGSGTLLSQIELSKKGEIYLPGSPDYIIIAEKKKLIIENSDQIVAYLVPAIITPAGNPANIHTLEDLTRPGLRLGIGNPETVCLGLYGIELLEKNSLLEPVLKNVVTFGGSCSKTANLAALNKVDAILGWRVFHFWNPERMEFVAINPKQIPRISYIPISIPVYTKDVNLSKAFIEYTLSPIGKSIYKKYGYLSILEDAKKFAPEAAVGGLYTLPDKYFEIIKDLWKK
ncbi:MAG: molybdate ABC transporter substrate-binding protein [Proteobacteria bacterium]|nr:molybdate ABC transporter substrate-binding protein [Pseudomonadota bacterium]